MNKKRNWVYLFLVCASVLLIIGKQYAVVRGRDKIVVSTISEWKEKGKPVIVYKVEKRDVPIYTTITGKQVAEHLFEGYVSKEVHGQIKVGQEISFQTDGEKLKGVISMVADEISLDTGMYRVQTFFDELLDLNSWIVVSVRIGTLNDVICIPNEIIDKEDEDSFVWKAVDGKSVRQRVLIGQQDGYGVVVIQGLSEGDWIIVSGFSRLSDGDKINILRNISIEEIVND